MFKLKIPSKKVEKLNAGKAGSGPTAEKSPRARLGARELIGIDLNGDNLKIVHLIKSPGKKEVANLSSKDISGLSDEDIARAIRTSLGELKAKNPAIITVVSSDSIITKNIEIPSTEAKEIREIINLQASRHTPYSRDEIIVDYISIGSFKHSYTKVLLIIVTRNIVKRQFEILHKAGFRLGRVLLAAEGLSWSIGKLSKLKTDSAPISVAHIDGHYTDFTVVFQNKTIFVRNIPIGIHEIVKEERYRERFIEELKGSLEAYHSENVEKAPSALILTGAVDEVGGLVEPISKAVNMSTQVVNYVKNLQFSDKAFKIASKTRDLSYLNVIAPLLAFEESKVDLIPDEIKMRRALEERGRDLVKVGVLILMVFASVFSMLISDIFLKDALLKTIRKKYESIGLEARELEKNFTKIALIKKYLCNRGRSLEVLAELFNVIPMDLELNNIRFDSDGNVSLKGTAGSMSTVFSFVNDMERSEVFKEVETKHTTKRKDGKRDVTDFELRCFAASGIY
ncbi:MAG: pilus assembly protein PilM [Candidatus Omnitrophota bacterium]